MSKKIARLFLLVSLSSLPGCVTGPGKNPFGEQVEGLREHYGERANVRKTIQVNGQNYQYDEVIFNYRAEYDATPINEEAKRKALRNRIMGDAMLIIDNSFAEYEAALLGGKAISNVATDAVVLALNTAGAVTGGTELKAILAATSAGVVGLRASVDKEFFADQAPIVFVQVMRALREQGRAELERKMRLSDSNYPLSLAISDLVLYFNAGTLVSAHAKIAQDAQQAKEVAKTESEANVNSLIEEDLKKEQAAATATLELQKEVLQNVFEQGSEGLQEEVLQSLLKSGYFNAEAVMESLNLPTETAPEEDRDSQSPQQGASDSTSQSLGGPG